MIARFLVVPTAAAAMLIGGSAIAQTGQAAIAGTRLDITAEGAVNRTPDLAQVNAGVITQAASANAAMRDNAARMAATVAALKRAGVADRDIQTAAISLSPQYR